MVKSSSSLATDLPSSILIVGSGVFGLGTAYALAQRPHYKDTTITVLDRYPTIPSSHTATTGSVDTTRIVRADYADPGYARLAREAQELWRQESWGGEGRYTETGLCLTADVGQDTYVQSAQKNVRNLEREQGDESKAETGDQTVPKIQQLSSPAEIAAALGCGGAATGSGTIGYINRYSGWTHAENAMRHLRGLVDKTGRVKFVAGEATRLIQDPTTNRVTGVNLKDGTVVNADQTIVAAGSWSGSLVDLRGVASARGECIGYMDLSEEEATALKGLPVIYNMGSGCFFFEPNSKAEGGWEIKVAQHTFGYTNPVRFEAPVGADKDEKTIVTSLPAFPKEGIPPADKERLADFLLDCLPILSKSGKTNRRLARSRMCYYLDTESSDWLICPYPVSSASPTASTPAYPSLFMATGGSGHGFKFLPVIGEKIVDVLDGSDKLAEKTSGMWTKKWAWPGKYGTLRTDKEAAGLHGHLEKKLDAGNDRDDGEVWCRDGSRGGTVGLNLSEAFRTPTVSKL